MVFNKKLLARKEILLQFSCPDACSLAGPMPHVLTFVLPRFRLPPSSFFSFAHFICSILLNCVFRALCPFFLTITYCCLLYLYLVSRLSLSHCFVYPGCVLSYLLSYLTLQK